MNRERASLQLALAGWITRGVVRAWPEETKHWARAFRAELPEIERPGTSLRWALGGVIMLTRAWWNHMLRSWNRPAGVPEGGALEAQWKNTPRVPRTPRWVTAVLLVACVGIVLVPEVQEAMSAVVDAWRNVVSEQFLPTSRSVEHFRKEAVQTQDPQLLAFAALLSENPKERRELADKAVALDSSLTWIYFELDHDWDTAKNAPLDRAKRLQQWDPDNAAAWLASADVAFKEVTDTWIKPGGASDFSREQQQFAQNSAWMAAMDRAFDAPRYDSYTERVFELYRTVAERYKFREPVVLLNLLSRATIPNLLAIRMYGAAQFDRAAGAERAGKRAEAARLYRRVAAFGEEMRGSGHMDIEQLIGIAIEKGAYERLQPLLRSDGDAGEAAMVQRGLEALQASAEYNRDRWPVRFANDSWSGLMLFILTAGAFLCAAALLFGLSFLCFAKRQSGSGRWGFSLSSVIVDYCPVLLLLVLGGLFAAYHPIAQVYDIYLSAPRSVSDFPGLVDSLAVPYRALEVFPGGGEAKVHFWTATTGALFLIAAYVLFRGKLGRRATA